jgi:hypothetical protein
MCRGIGRASVLLSLALTGEAWGQGTPAAGAPGAPAGPATDAPPDAACIVARNNALTGITELAAGDESYLVLDLATSDITIALHAVPLRIFPVLAVEAATEAEATRNIWQAHRGGVFSPARTENPPEELPVTLEGETEEVVQIHLPPAERFPAPPTFRVTFADGLAVEFQSGEGASAAAGGLSARIASWFGRESEAKPALRVRMDPVEAGDLYRALPPEIALVIEPDCA